MGANAQTSVPLFTAGEVLTAVNQNLSAGTGVPVFATTVTRDAAFGGTGEKVLAEGQLAYIEADNVVQYYDGAAWETVGPASAGALTLISATTIGNAVSSVTVSNAFSSTYDAYQIVVSGGVASTANDLNMTFGSTTTGYYYFRVFSFYSGSTQSLSNGNNTSFFDAGLGSTNTLNANCFVINPNLAKRTVFQNWRISASSVGVGGFVNGFEDSNTQHTAFTITASTGTFTGGTIRVYGLANS